jgi:hypothetical protein
MVFQTNSAQNAPIYAVLLLLFLCVSLLQAKLGNTPSLALVKTAVHGYTGAMPANLQLMGPSVLHSCQVSSEGNMMLPPNGGGCPLGPDGAPLEGAKLRHAAVNLFGTITVKVCAPSECVVMAQALQTGFLQTGGGNSRRRVLQVKVVLGQ